MQCERGIFILHFTAVMQHWTKDRWRIAGVQSITRRYSLNPSRERTMDSTNILSQFDEGDEIYNNDFIACYSLVLYVTLLSRHIRSIGRDTNFTVFQFVFMSTVTDF